MLKPYQVDYVGFADLRNYQDEIDQLKVSIVRGYPYGISIGIKIPDSIIDYLPERENMNIAGEYRKYGYEILNNRLNTLASIVSTYLSRKGYRTLPLTATESDDEKATAIVSHKMIAHIAGIGWIGKNCLLITPDNGPRVRFISILTHAPLRAADNPMDDKCGLCMECVGICPTKSINGKNYRKGETREERFEYEKCQNYLRGLKEHNKYSVCGMCLYICPYGMKK